MPTYSYACTACAHRFETVQAFSDTSLTACPECAGRLRKLFSSVGIVFKGSGFYRTDSRSAPVGAAGEGSSDSTKSDSTKSDSTKPGSKKSDTSSSTSTSPSTVGSRPSAGDG